MELEYRNTLDLNGQNYQNYDINGSGFLPFAFSGAIVNRNGDNVSASLVFPNNELSRSWASTAVNQGWLAVVAVIVNGTELYQYTGQVSSGSWDLQAVKLELNTILDSVGQDIPFRTLSEDLIGPLPTSSGVRLS